MLRYYTSYTVILSNMAGYHTLLPSVLSFLGLKKHVMILHGAECNTLPDINYGIFTKPLLASIAGFSMRHATLLLPVSEHLLYQKNTYLSEPGLEMGLRQQIRGNLPRVTVIHNGIDTKKFTINNPLRQEKSFLTVAGGLDSKRTYLLKGIDLILEMARLNPDCRFTIVGSSTIYMYQNDIPNVTIAGPVPNEELAAIYNEHMYYCQLSMSEGCPVSLCEAMACGCIPIVSRVSIMPEIVGDTGFILDRRDAGMLQDLIRNTVLKQHKNGKEARKRVCDHFDIDLRAQKLLDAIGHLSSRTSP